MTLRYLLDTNICIYIKRERPAAVRARMARQRPGSLGMSVVTWGELQFGASKSQQADAARANLAALTQVIAVLPMSEEVAGHYGDIRAVLERQGTPIGNNDLWIAAHARAEGLTLVTNNTREFSRVSGLKLANWAEDAAK